MVESKTFQTRTVTTRTYKSTPVNLSQLGSYQRRRLPKSIGGGVPTEQPMGLKAATQDVQTQVGINIKQPTPTKATTSLKKTLSLQQHAPEITLSNVGGVDRPNIALQQQQERLRLARESQLAPPKEKLKSAKEFFTSFAAEATGGLRVAAEPIVKLFPKSKVAKISQSIEAKTLKGDLPSFTAGAINIIGKLGKGETDIQKRMAKEVQDITSLRAAGKRTAIERRGKEQLGEFVETVRPGFEGKVSVRKTDLQKQIDEGITTVGAANIQLKQFSEAQTAIFQEQVNIRGKQIGVSSQAELESFSKRITGRGEIEKVQKQFFKREGLQIPTAIKSTALTTGVFVAALPVIKVATVADIGVRAATGRLDFKKAGLAVAAVGAATASSFRVSPLRASVKLGTALLAAGATSKAISLVKGIQVQSAGAKALAQGKTKFSTERIVSGVTTKQTTKSLLDFKAVGRDFTVSTKATTISTKIAGGKGSIIQIGGKIKATSPKGFLQKGINIKGVLGGRGVSDITGVKLKALTVVPKGAGKFRVQQFTTVISKPITEGRVFISKGALFLKQYGTLKRTTITLKAGGVKKLLGKPINIEKIGTSGGRFSVVSVFTKTKGPQDIFSTKGIASVRTLFRGRTVLEKGTKILKRERIFYGKKGQIALGGGFGRRGTETGAEFIERVGLQRGRSITDRLLDSGKATIQAGGVLTKRGLISGIKGLSLQVSRQAFITSLSSKLILGGGQSLPKSLISSKAKAKGISLSQQVSLGRATSLVAGKATAIPETVIITRTSTQIISPTISPTSLPSFIPPITPRVYIPIIPLPFDVGGGGTSRLLSGKRRKKRKTRRQTSLVGAALKIKGKFPKRLTGLEIRPLLRGMF